MALGPIDPSNHFPVLNLSFLGKVVERVAAEQLQVFLEGTSVLDTFRSSFCPGHGVEMALIALTDQLHWQLDYSGSDLLLLLVPTAAFNTINQDLLIHCLAKMKICRTGLKWFVSFIQVQGQRVAMGGRVLP